MEANVSTIDIDKTSENSAKYSQDSTDKSTNSKKKSTEESVESQSTEKTLTEKTKSNSDISTDNKDMKDNNVTNSKDSATSSQKPSTISHPIPKKSFKPLAINSIFRSQVQESSATQSLKRTSPGVDRPGSNTNLTLTSSISSIKKTLSPGPTLYSNVKSRSSLSNSTIKSQQPYPSSVIGSTGGLRLAPMRREESARSNSPSNSSLSGSSNPNIPQSVWKKNTATTTSSTVLISNETSTTSANSKSTSSIKDFSSTLTKKVSNTAIPSQSKDSNTPSTKSSDNSTSTPASTTTTTTTTNPTSASSTTNTNVTASATTTSTSSSTNSSSIRKNSKEFSEEELKKLGIHLATSIHTSSSGTGDDDKSHHLNWAEDDDDINLDLDTDFMIPSGSSNSNSNSSSKSKPEDKSQSSNPPKKHHVQMTLSSFSSKQSEKDSEKDKSLKTNKSPVWASIPRPNNISSPIDIVEEELRKSNQSQHHHTNSRSNDNMNPYNSFNMNNNSFSFSSSFASRRTSRPGPPFQKHDYRPQHEFDRSYPFTSNRNMELYNDRSGQFEALQGNITSPINSASVPSNITPNNLQANHNRGHSFTQVEQKNSSFNTNLGLNSITNPNISNNTGPASINKSTDTSLLTGTPDSNDSGQSVFNGNSQLQSGVTPDSSRINNSSATGLARRRFSSNSSSSSRPDFFQKSNNNTNFNSSSSSAAKILADPALPEIIQHQEKLMRQAKEEAKKRKEAELQAEKEAEEARKKRLQEIEKKLEERHKKSLSASKLPNTNNNASNNAISTGSSSQNSANSISNASNSNSNNSAGNNTDTKNTLNVKKESSENDASSKSHASDDEDLIHQMTVKNVETLVTEGSHSRTNSRETPRSPYENNKRSKQFWKPINSPYLGSSSNWSSKSMNLKHPGPTPPGVHNLWSNFNDTGFKSFDNISKGSFFPSLQDSGSGNVGSKTSKSSGSETTNTGSEFSSSSSVNSHTYRDQNQQQSHNSQNHSFPTVLQNQNNFDKRRLQGSSSKFRADHRDISSSTSTNTNNRFGGSKSRFAESWRKMSSDSNGNPSLNEDQNSHSYEISSQQQPGNVQSHSQNHYQNSTSPHAQHNQLNQLDASPRSNQRFDILSGRSSQSPLSVDKFSTPNSSTTLNNLSPMMKGSQSLPQSHTISRTASRFFPSPSSSADQSMDSHVNISGFDSSNNSNSQLDMLARVSSSLSDTNSVLLSSSSLFVDDFASTVPKVVLPRMIPQTTPSNISSLPGFSSPLSSQKQPPHYGPGAIGTSPNRLLDNNSRRTSGASSLRSPSSTMSLDFNFRPKSNTSTSNNFESIQNLIAQRIKEGAAQNKLSSMNPRELKIKENDIFTTEKLNNNFINNNNSSNENNNKSNINNNGNVSNNNNSTVNNNSSNNKIDENKNLSSGEILELKLKEINSLAISNVIELHSSLCWDLDLFECAFGSVPDLKFPEKISNKHMKSRRPGDNTLTYALPSSPLPINFATVSPIHTPSYYGVPDKPEDEALSGHSYKIKFPKQSTSLFVPIEYDKSKHLYPASKHEQKSKKLSTGFLSSHRINSNLGGSLNRRDMHRMRH